MVVALQVRIDDRGARVGAHPVRAALVRGRAPVERTRQNQRITRAPQGLFHAVHQHLVRAPVRAFPVQHDPVAAQGHAAVGIGQVLGHRQEVDGAPGDPVRQRARDGRVGGQDRARDLAQKLDVAQGRAIRAAGQVEIVHHQRFLIDGIVAPERVHCQHRAEVVVHEIAPHLVRAVGKPGGMGLGRRAQQQDRRHDRPRRQHDDRCRQGLAIRQPDGGDAAIRPGVEPVDGGAGAQRDVGVLQRQRKAHGFRVHLAAAGVRKGIPWRAPLGQPAVDIHPQRQRGRVQPHARQTAAQVGDGGFVRDGGKGIGARMRRFGRVLADLAAHLIEGFGLLVPRLQRVIAKGPAGRRALDMAQGGEILRAVADQHGAVEFRIPAAIVIIAGVEGRARRVQPFLVGAEMAAGKDRVGVARLGRVFQPVAPLEDQDAQPRRRQRGGQRGPAHARADDDDIGPGHGRSPGVGVARAVTRFAPRSRGQRPRPCPC